MRDTRKKKIKNKKKGVLTYEEFKTALDIALREEREQKYKFVTVGEIK